MIPLGTDLNTSHEELQQAAIDFAKDALGHDMIERDREQAFDRDDWQKCAEFGVQGMPIPQEYGGLGLGILPLIGVMEGLGYGCRDSGLLFSLNAHLWTNSIPILIYGTEEQKTRWLPPLCDGSLVGANGASEPDAGSDIFSMRTRATRRGNEYVLNGAKTFVTNAPVADLFVVYATIDPALGPMGITAFIVERDRPGLNIGKHMEKMGLRTSPMAEVVLEDCIVPIDNRLGREGRGVEIFECSMEWERGCILGSFLGVMRRQLEGCIAHARSRKQFGKAIGKFQSVANRIVDMRVRLDTSRPMVYRIGELKEQNKTAVLEASIAKLYVSEALVQSALDAVQIYGGYGYMTEQEVERDLRDAVAGTLYSGTSEIQRNIIARSLGL
ncbi:MAG: acyl-CoA dehydrogenase [Acidobacteria bacterium]|nr:acyl-CoA dehydrogenase [Acidobacteriota bacterium]